LICAGLVKRVEVLTMQILDQSLFETHCVVGLMNERGYRLESCATRGTETAFPCDQLVFIRTDLSHQNRLKNANRLDRVHERGQALLTKLVAGLERVRADTGEWHFTEHGTGCNTRRRRDERP
jgi:hypothetical protein